MKKEFMLNECIAYYRKLNCLTQSELAQKAGVTTAAVSKWEQKLSCPDVVLLPLLAEIFNISIDELFGLTVNKEPVYDYVASLPWEDDRKMRIGLFYGKKLMAQSEHIIHENENDISFHFECNNKIKVVCKVFCKNMTVIQ